MRWSIEDFVYGGTDGAVTTFAIVSGAFGASLSIPIILILGFANLFADGFSMSIGNYLSEKTHKEYICYYVLFIVYITFYEYSYVGFESFKSDCSVHILYKY